MAGPSTPGRGVPRTHEAPLRSEKQVFGFRFRVLGLGFRA